MATVRHRQTPRAAGVRSKIWIIILTGKTLCIWRSTRMVNFRQKPYLGPGNVLVGAKALQIRVRTHTKDPGAQIRPYYILIINLRKSVLP
jgi:hypothetical protein